MNVQRLKRRRVITSLLIFDTNQYLDGADILARTTCYDDAELVKLRRKWMRLIRPAAKIRVTARTVTVISIVDTCLTLFSSVCYRRDYTAICHESSNQSHLTS
jgi:hypothetical protein